MGGRIRRRRDQEWRKASARRRRSKFPLARKRPHACSIPCGKARPAQSHRPPRSTLSGIASCTAGRDFEDPVVITPKVKSAIAECFRFRSSSQSRRARGHGDHRETVRRGAAGCSVRHWFHKKHAARRRRCIPGRMNGSRTEFAAMDFMESITILRPPRGATAGQRLGIVQAGDLSSGQWLFAGRNSRRAERRHHDGLHAARRTDDGHAFGLGRSRNPHLPDASKTSYGRTAR